MDNFLKKVVLHLVMASVAAQCHAHLHDEYRNSAKSLQTCQERQIYMNIHAA